MALAPCPLCARHVRVPAPPSPDARCPFCSAGLGEVVAIVRPQPRLRLGRAAIFAFGGAALSATAGCYEHHVRGAPPPEPPRARDAGVEASLALLYGTPPDPMELDAGSVDSLYGAPPPPDAGVDAGEITFPAYGTPPPPPLDAGADAGGLVAAYGAPTPIEPRDAGREDEDVGGFVDLYGGPPAP